MYTRERAPRRAGALDGADGGAARARARSTSTGRCPATRTCSARSPSTSATTCSPTSGCSQRDRARFAFAERAGRRAAARRGRAGGRQLRHRPRAWSPRELGFDERRAELDRRRLRPRLRARLPGRRGDLRDAPLAAGRRARAVVERRVRLLRAARRVELGLLDHAAEEEPRRGRAAAREGAAHRRPPGARCTA